MNLMTKSGQPVDLRPHPQNMAISHQQQIPLNSHYQFALAYSPASFPTVVQNPAVVHHNHKTAAHHQIHPQNHQIYSPLPAPLPPPQFVQVSSSSGGYTPTAYSTVSFSPGSPPATQPPLVPSYAPAPGPALSGAKRRAAPRSSRTCVLCADLCPRAWGMNQPRYHDAHNVFLCVLEPQWLRMPCQG